MRFKIFSEDFKKIVSLLDKMTDEAVFTVDKESNSLSIRLMNIERTAFVELIATVDVREDGKFALRVKDLKKIVKMFKKEELEFAREEEGFITVKGEKKSIKFPEIEAEEFEETLPEFEFSVKFKLDKSEYQQLVKDVKELGDALKITGDKIIVVDSQYEYEYKLEDVEGQGEIVVGVALFSLPLQLKADIYEMKFGEGTPFIVDVEDETLTARFVLAPRVED